MHAGHGSQQSVLVTGVTDTQAVQLCGAQTQELHQVNLGIETITLEKTTEQLY